MTDPVTDKAAATNKTATRPAPLTALLVCPGRGQYQLDELWPARRPGLLPPEAMVAWEDAIRALDAARALRGAPPLAGEVAREGVKASADLAPDVVSALIFAAGAADLGTLVALERAGAHRTVAVTGMSLGFYTALYVAGALPLPDAARLVDTMGAFQVRRGQVGGQLVYPVVADEDWRPDPARRAVVDGALAAARAQGGLAERSIRLGGYEVLAGDDTGLGGLEKALPREARKGVTYPVRLPGHSAFHTDLMRPMSDAAWEPLADLFWGPPRVPLVTGDGTVLRPRSAAPEAVYDYTLGEQVTATYDFALALRVALREYAPDAVVALGPGDTLGGPIGQTLVLEGWAGIRDREAFRSRQASASPILFSMGRAQDRARLAAT